MNSSAPLWKRRSVIKAVSASLGVLALRGYDVLAESAAHYTHGVASGDPLADRVILWTRVIPGAGQHEQLPVSWQVSKDQHFKRIITSGEAMTSRAIDYTFKADAIGLKPDTDYFYRFIANGVISPVGRTKTLPSGRVSKYRLGVTSCSNYPQGYFNAYRHMAEQDLDVVLHLGDYIYEYPEGGYANPIALNQLQRHVKPDNELLNLDDYRTRYGLYRTDADLQALHARHPFICVWDDHELANNTWKAGAENHNEGEGDFDARMRAARQAYHEWLPIRTRTSDQEPIYRTFKIGDLADLIMLDTRLHGRDRGFSYQDDMIPTKGVWQRVENGKHKYLGTERDVNADGFDHIIMDLPFDFSSDVPAPIVDYELAKHAVEVQMPDAWGYQLDAYLFRETLLEDEARSILGLDQESWLKTEISDSKARNAIWQVLGQQVLIGKVNVPFFSEETLAGIKLNNSARKLVHRMRHLNHSDLPFNLDAWDGYGPARRRLYRDLAEYGTNPIVLAGDTHNAWAFNLGNDLGEPIGIEIGTPGVTSPGLERFLGLDPELMAKLLLEVSPELVQTDTSQRGWAELTLTPKQASSQFHFVSTILSREFTVNSSQPLICKKGERKFQA